MLDQQKLDRISELSQRAREGALTEQEAQERTRLRGEYLEAFRASMRDTIENLTVLDPKGNDVTPEKVRRAKGEKFSD